MHGLRKRLGRTSYQKRKLAGLLAILLGLLLIVITVERGLRPMVKSIAEDKARSVTTRIVNQAVADQLTAMNLDYEDMVELDQDDQGNISAVRTKMAAVNRFQAEISLAVQTAIDTYQAEKITIPFGTLTGSELLDGRGPSIPLTVTLTGSMTATIASGFESAGINQTRHRITLTISTDVRAVVPWYGVTTQVVNDYIVAETILVGNVPDAYTHVISGDGSVAEDIFLYGKNETNVGTPPAQQAEE